MPRQAPRPSGRRKSGHRSLPPVPALHVGGETTPRQGGVAPDHARVRTARRQGFSASANTGTTPCDARQLSAHLCLDPRASHLQNGGRRGWAGSRSASFAAISSRFSPSASLTVGRSKALSKLSIHGYTHPLPRTALIKGDRTIPRERRYR